jgi:hypothetical protein
MQLLGNGHEGAQQAQVELTRHRSAAASFTPIDTLAV